MYNDMTYTYKFHHVHRSQPWTGTGAVETVETPFSGAMGTDLLQSPNPGATVQVLQHQGVPASCNKKVSN